MTSLFTTTVVSSTTVLPPPASTNTQIVQYTSTTTAVSTATTIATVPYSTAFGTCPGGDDSSYISPNDGRAYQMYCDVSFAPVTGSSYISKTDTAQTLSQCVEYCSTVQGCTAVTWLLNNDQTGRICYAQNNQYTIEQQPGCMAANLTGEPIATATVTAGPTVTSACSAPVVTASSSVSR